MALKQITYGSTEYNKMILLRNEVLRIPLGLTFTSEELANEKNDLFIGAFDEDQIIGCCILTIIDFKSVRLRQMAVQKTQQRKGIGKSILHFAENIAKDKGYSKLMMHARNTAIGFYKKMGYNLSGEQFIEANIYHHYMEKKL
jgi:N-acetylglutamate synthase-like GNAT family acetyltransferase